MPLVQYVGNHNPNDGNGAYKFVNAENGSERVLLLGGPPLEISDSEYGLIQGRCALNVIDAAESSAGSASSSASTTQNPATPSASGFTKNPSTPSQGS